MNTPRLVSNPPSSPKALPHRRRRFTEHTIFGRVWSEADYQTPVVDRNRGFPLAAPLPRQPSLYSKSMLPPAGADCPLLVSPALWCCSRHLRKSPSGRGFAGLQLVALFSSSAFLAIVDSVIAASPAVFNPGLSNAATLAAGISRVPKDDSTIATGNAPTGVARPWPRLLGKPLL